MRLSQARALLLKDDRKRWPLVLQAIPADQWPPPRPGMKPPIQALRSRDFMVQVFEEGDGVLRMTVNRTDLKGWDNGQPLWRDGISWDDLQRLKDEAGYSDRWAVEIFPPNSEVVNVANMRHLWLLPVAPEYGWKRRTA